MEVLDSRIGGGEIEARLMLIEGVLKTLEGFLRDSLTSDKGSMTIRIASMLMFFWGDGGVRYNYDPHDAGNHSIDPVNFGFRGQGVP